jgi:hypothetical protein
MLGDEPSPQSIEAVMQSLLDWLASPLPVSVTGEPALPVTC